MQAPTQFSYIEFEDGSTFSLKGMSCQQLAAWIEARYPDAEIGYYPDRGLVWATEEDSLGDDGQHAIATIYYQEAK